MIWIYYNIGCCLYIIYLIFKSIFYYPISQHAYIPIYPNDTPKNNDKTPIGNLIRGYTDISVYT